MLDVVETYNYEYNKNRVYPNAKALKQLLDDAHNYCHIDGSIFSRLQICRGWLLELLLLPPPRHLERSCRRRVITLPSYLVAARLGANDYRNTAWVCVYNCICIILCTFVCSLHVCIYMCVLICAYLYVIWTCMCICTCLLWLGVFVFVCACVLKLYF